MNEPEPPSINPIGNTNVPNPAALLPLNPVLEAITREGDPLGNVTRFEFNSLVHVVQQLVGGTTAPVEAPTNVDVPFAQQELGELTCTMGNWTGEPTSYAYQWMRGGDLVGTDSASYTLLEGDVGSSFTCTVTATNAGGSTTAPPSNVVEVIDPGATTTRTRRGR